VATGTIKAQSRPELERRPIADSSSVEDLLLDIRQGRIRVPQFQRGLKWEDEDRRKLFDSILRGYPVGTLLFWKRPAPAATVHIGRMEVDAEERSDALWVVDGQQRLTTLADALLVELGAGERERRLFVDLETLEATYGRDLNPPRWLPLFDAADTERLHEWVHQSSPSDSFRRSAFAVGKRLREYQVPLYVVESDDEDVLRRIFDRVNSTGKALEKDEVFDALHGGRGGEFPSSLEEIAQSLEATGFGHLDHALVLRALLALRRKDPSRGFRQIERSDVPAALRDTALGLERAVYFVKGVAGFPHVSLLPYKLPLATLALFLHEHPEPNPRTKTLLRRWIWRGAINGSHRGDTVGLRRTLTAIDPQDEERSVQALLQGLGETNPGALELRPFNFRHARSKLQLVALAALAPRDLRSGEPIDVTELCERDGNPAQRLVSDPSPGEPEVGLAGRVLHPRLPPTELRKLIGKADDLLRGSHGIPAAAAAALASGEVEAFFREREGHLEQVVSRFLDRQAEWGASDRPSLEYLKAMPVG
jgi:hypothetical protein